MSQAAQRDPAVTPPPNAVRAALPSGWILAGCVAMYLVLTLALIATVPINATPDEAAHVQYVQHLATLGELPVFEARSALDAGGERAPGYEYHQPPLYYLLCVPLWKATGPGVQQYMCRLVSLLCGALTLVLLWHAVRTLFPENPNLTVIATGFAALWPLHQGVGASAGNDALAGLVSAAIFTRIARGARCGTTVRDLVVLGGLCGLGLLTKTSCLVWLFLAMGVAWHFCGRDRRREPGSLSPVLGAAAVLGVTLLVSGWWLVRNQTLYGDPFALNAFNKAFGNDPSAQLMLAVEMGAIPIGKYLLYFLFVLSCTTWGIFGGPETARHMYNPLSGHRLSPGAAPALCLLGVCIVATVIAGWGFTRYARSWRSQEPETHTALLWWASGLALVTLAFIAFNAHYFQAQARYFHPALLPLALAFALGWQRFWSRVGQGALWINTAGFGLILIALTLWNVLDWHTLV